MKRLLREPLLHFLLLGSLLFLARDAWEPLLTRLAGSERIEVTAAVQQRLRSEWLQETGRRPDERELAAMIRQHIDEEILFREALRQGLHERDPVVHQRLARNMRFIRQQEEADTGALVEAALALGMLERDLVVRRRLVQLMQHRIESGVEIREADLRAFYQAQPELFSQPPRYRFRQIFFSADKHGAAASDKARETLNTLQTTVNHPPPDKLGDPFTLGHSFGFLSAREIEKSLGGDIAMLIESAQPGSWWGPVTSVYGQHLLQVEAVQPGQVTDFTNARGRAAALVFEKRDRLAVQQAVARLQNRYRIVISGGAGEENS